MLSSTFVATAFALPSILSWCLGPTSAARVKANNDAHRSVGSAGQLAAGRPLRGRYVLDTFIERVGLNVRSRRAPPGESFPAELRRQFSDANHLGTGSFGDVWSAIDKQTGQKVAVKILSRDGRYLSWRTAGPDVVSEFQSALKECLLNKEILRHRDVYPVGASRICACYDEHILDAKGTDMPVFLVQEMCGKSLGAVFINKHKANGTADVDGARNLTRQLLEGINFMQIFEPPLIHHDLKPDNVVITAGGEVKIIDWGGMVFGNPQSRFMPVIMTPAYAAPEVFSGRMAFAMPAHSYDVYAAGLVYLEILCPSMDARERSLTRPLTPYKVDRLVRTYCPGSLYSNIQEDLKLVNAMVHREPSQRPAPKNALGAPVLQPPSTRAPPATKTTTAVARTARSGGRGRLPPEGVAIQIDVELLPEVPRVGLTNQDPLFGKHVMDPNEVKHQEILEGQASRPLAPWTFPSRGDLNLLPPRAVSKTRHFVRMQSFVTANAMEGWTWTFHTCEARCTCKDNKEVHDLPWLWTFHTSTCKDDKDIKCKVDQQANALFGTFYADVPKKATQCYVRALATCTITQALHRTSTHVQSYIKRFTVPSDFSG